MPVDVDMKSLVANPELVLGSSAWHLIPQEAVNQFGQLTGDEQWIHTDAVRAAATPFRTTLAHGFHTLALLSSMLFEALSVEDAGMVINYGLNKVRFITPVPAGGRVRGHFAALEVSPFDGGIQVTWKVTIELDGASRPACVAEWITRSYVVS